MSVFHLLNTIVATLLYNLACRLNQSFFFSNQLFSTHKRARWSLIVVVHTDKLEPTSNVSTNLHLLPANIKTATYELQNFGQCASAETIDCFGSFTRRTQDYFVHFTPQRWFFCGELHLLLPGCGQLWVTESCLANFGSRKFAAVHASCTCCLLVTMKIYTVSKLLHDSAFVRDLVIPTSL